MSQKLKLTESNYFSAEANKAYMSVSQYKEFEKCEARAMAELEGRYEPPTSTALLQGQYFDACFDDDFDSFYAAHPEAFKRDGTLRAEYVTVLRSFERAKRDRYFTKLMSGEHQVIMTGTINGVDVKIKIDSLLPDMIVDSKLMKDMENLRVDDRGVLPFFEAYRYDIQGAVYQEIVRQNTGKTMPFVLAVVTKEEHPDIEAIRIEQDTLKLALHRFSENVAAYDAIKKGVVEPERCLKCDYCHDTKVLEAPISSAEFYFE